MLRRWCIEGAGFSFGHGSYRIHAVLIINRNGLDHPSVAVFLENINAGVSLSVE